MYDSAYSKSAKLYNKFHTIREVSILDNIPNSNILGIAIVNIATTELAAFLEYIGATEWFRQGHEKYSEKAAGKCPYCSRPLPDNFEQYVTASFDTWYKENLMKLDSFYTSYSTQSQSLLTFLSGTPAENYPAVDTKRYYDKLNSLKGVISVNLERIKEKKADPAKIITLDSTAPILQELAGIITDFNELIVENNNAVNNSFEKREECRNNVFEHMAFILRDTFETYNI